MTRDELKGKIAGVIADARNEDYDGCLTMDLDEAVDSVLSLIDEERCEWTKISVSYAGGYNYKTCYGYEFKVHSYFKNHIYCPYCGKRIEVKEVKDGQ
jgi:hypothetical protein